MAGFSAVGNLVLRARTTGLVPSRTSSQVVQAADYVRAHSAPTDRLLVWGLSGGLYFLAQRPLAALRCDPAYEAIYDGEGATIFARR